MTLRVLSAGGFATMQDLGRMGYERFGVTQGGAMDPFALRAANRLVGNLPGAAGLEFIHEPLALQTSEDCLVAVTGCGYSLSILDRSVGAWRAAIARKGETIHVMAGGEPGWGYLAVLGGIDVPLVMGSRSTALRGGFGGFHGRTLQIGDSLPVGHTVPEGWRHMAGCWLPPEKRPVYSNHVTVLAILGPQAEAFTDDALETFFSSEYMVSATSDRMGYRLIGPKIEHKGSADMLSEPIPWGAIQVPADGQPIVMMADRPTTGGYTKIATVARVGLPLLAQAVPGWGTVRFSRISVEDAQVSYRASISMLEQGIQEDHDEWPC